MNTKIIEEFAKKWKMESGAVEAIYHFIENYGGKYGKCSRGLASLGIQLNSRQLKYFYRKIKLLDRIDIKKNGKPKNYSKLLNSL